MATASALKEFVSIHKKGQGVILFGEILLGEKGCFWYPQGIKVRDHTHCIPNLLRELRLSGKEVAIVNPLVLAALYSRYYIEDGDIICSEEDLSELSVTMNTNLNPEVRVKTFPRELFVEKFGEHTLFIIE